MKIKLSSVLPIDNPSDYKMHMAFWNGSTQPLDAFVRDKSEWVDWNTWRSSKNDFNRQYIFSLMDFYHEPDVWLFGGIFEVIKRRNKNYTHSYDVQSVGLGHEFVGRLKLKLKRPGRARVFRFENYCDDLEVLELLPKPYSGEAFVGLEWINRDFPFLEAVFKSGQPDWKAALENVKGVYLIADHKTGRKYVGAAYGNTGIWGRWACYMGTGHGWTDELTRLIKREGIDYARENFVFSLLEYRPMRTDDKEIIEREGYWKDALLTRTKFGYNKN